MTNSEPSREVCNDGMNCVCFLWEQMKEYTFDFIRNIIQLVKKIDRVIS